MASMDKEFFWGCELSKDKKEYSWDSEDEELSKADIEQKLIVSQACLAAKAKPNERNRVEVTTTDISQNSVTYSILSLKSGETEQCRLGLGFPSSVVFKLVEGSGPVHLTGSVYQELFITEDSGDDDESDEDEKSINFVNPEEKVASKKRPLAPETPKGPPMKLARMEDAENEDESDEDEDEEEEEEESEDSEKMEVDTKQKKDKQNTTPKPPSKADGKTVEKEKAKDKAKGKQKAGSGDEESDEDDDDEEGEDEEGSEEEEGDDDDDDDDDEEGDDEDDEDDDEDDDDEDEDDESEEQDEMITSLLAKNKKKGGKEDAKRKFTNGVAKHGKTPKAEERQKANKTTAKQPSTPKTEVKKEETKKSASKSPQPMDIDQIKTQLKKRPGLPRKVEKFKNYMRSSFKVTDDEVITELWDWLQTNK